TSDMHKKLTADYAHTLRNLKAGTLGSLMFDSGDAIWSGNIYWRLGGEPVLDLMNSVPYDALCMGNREFHFLGIGVNGKIHRALFPVLSANIRSARKNGHVPVPSHSIFERDGVRVAVFGLTVPCITERMLVKKVSDYYFEPPISTAAAMVQKLKKEADIVIALTHIGIKSDRELAEGVPGIDLILGGHTHVLAEERVGETCVIHHGFYAHYVGRVDLNIESGKITQITNELIPLAKA
ncbi:metallophosphoesterase, partial [bacterium]|nr:metallophosphoesterase [bacterium]